MMMTDLSLHSLVIVVGVAFLAPLLLGACRWLRVPSVVVEIVAGIVVGPSVLGWVRVDPPIQVLALIGLAFLLLLAGLEIDLGRLRGRSLQTTTAGFLLSLGLGLAVGFGLHAAGLVQSPLLVAIMLAATSLGVVIPVLKDSGESGSDFGQLVIGAATVADFATIILLSLFFSREMSGPGAQLLLIGLLAALALGVGLAVLRVEHWGWLSALLVRLQDTTAQIRVRGAFLLLAAFVALAQRLGLETLLGAFLAGVLLGVVDRDERMTHPQFRPKLESIGFGVFIPIFFVSSGVRFDGVALFAGGGLAMVPLFLTALLIVRGLPAIVYLPRFGARQTAAAGLLQATSLGFIVVAAQLGVELGLLAAGTGAALVAAGLASVLLFPLAALSMLRGAAPAGARLPAKESGALAVSRSA